jgi:hypothetical protein
MLPIKLLRLVFYATLTRMPLFNFPFNMEYGRLRPGRDSHYAISVIPVLGHSLYMCEYRLGASNIKSTIFQDRKLPFCCFRSKKDRM